jgi:hypothetical protein
VSKSVCAARVTLPVRSARRYPIEIAACGIQIAACGLDMVAGFQNRIRPFTSAEIKCSYFIGLPGQAKHPLHDPVCQTC